MINKISSTLMFQKTERVYQITERMSKVDLNKYVVPFNLLTRYTDEYKGYKYPFTVHVIKALNAKSIIPIIFADPIDKKDEKISWISGLTTFIKDGKNGKIAVSDISTKAGYSRDNQGKPVFLKCDSTALFTFMQSAYIKKQFDAYGSKIGANKTFGDYIVHLYGNILGNCLDKEFGMSAQPNGMQIISYLAGMYAAQFMLGIEDPNKAHEMVTSVSVKDLKGTVRRDIIEKESRCYQTNNLTMRNIEDFINCVKVEFPYINDKTLSFQILVFKWTEMYNQTALFALEDCFSFVNMLMHSNKKTFLFNELRLKKYKDEIQSFENSLAEQLSQY